MNLSCDLSVRGKRLSYRGHPRRCPATVTFHFPGSSIRQPDAMTTIETTIGAIVVIETDAMTVVTIVTAIAVIVDTIGIVTPTGVMSVIVTVPISPEISTTINCSCRRVLRCFRD